METKCLNKRKPFHELLGKWFKPIVVGIVTLLLSLWGVFIYFSCVPASDWQGNYFPAVHDLLRGNSPYINHAAFNPFWTYIFLIPFALLPPVFGNIAIGIVCIITFGFVAHKYGAKPISIILLLTIPQVRFLSVNGGIDWMPIIGFILPPQIGLFFVLIKPQVGICVAIFWFFNAWQKGKIREVIRVFAPITIAYLIGYCIFGMDAIWRGTEFINSNYPWDATTFPITISVGLILLIQSVLSQNIKFAIPASAFLTPYIAFYSWPAALFSIIDNTVLMIAASVGMWMMSIFY